MLHRLTLSSEDKKQLLKTDCASSEVVIAATVVREVALQEFAVDEIP